MIISTIQIEKQRMAKVGGYNFNQIESINGGPGSVRVPRRAVVPVRTMFGGLRCI